MIDRGTIERFLGEVSQGNREHFDFALSLLSSGLLITPVSLQEDGEQRTKKVRVVTLVRGGKKVIPTFTTEDYFLSWAGSDYQSFSVPGADLALSLPGDACLVIDPGQVHSIELTADEVARLANIPEQSLEALLLQADELRSPSTPISQTESVSGATPPVLDDLSRLFKNFEEIEQAYFEELLPDRKEAALGLVLGQIAAERRFHLMAEIAELSRLHFGMAGAIDVFENTDFSTLSVRDPFAGKDPFYRRVRKPTGPRGFTTTPPPNSSNVTPNVLHEREEDLPRKARVSVR